MIRVLTFVLAIVGSSSLWALDAPVIVNNQPLPPDVAAVKITEKLGEKVDVDNLKFKDEWGKEVVLAEFFEAGKPVILLMVYYKCPGICNYLLNGFTNSVRSLDWTIGEEYSVVTVSINPEEGPEMALGKKENYVRRYGRLKAEQGWRWLTGEEDQIQLLASQLGFGYKLDPQSKEYAHGSAIFVLTPEAVISRVLYGVDFPNKDLKLSLLEASHGKVGTILDRVWMLCYQYDPMSRGYALKGLRIVQAGGLLTLGILSLYLFFYWRRERRKTLAKESGV